MANTNSIPDLTPTDAETPSPINIGAISFDALNVADDAASTGVITEEPSVSPQLLYKKNKRRQRVIRYTLLALVLLIGSGAVVYSRNSAAKHQAANSQTTASQRYGSLTIPLTDDSNTASSLSVSGNRSLSINGQLNVNNSLVLSPSSTPTNAVAGQLYYDQTANQLSYYNGTKFLTVLSGGNAVQSIGSATGELKTGGGLAVADNTLSNSGVLTLQGQTGNLSLVGGTGVAIDGTTLSNSGVLSLGGQNGAITLGSGLAISNGQLNSTSGGVTGITSSSTSLTVTDDGNGNVTLGLASLPGTGTVTSGGGTAGKIAVFNGVQDIGDSLLSQAGSTVTVSGSLTVTGNLNLTTPLAVTSGGTGSTTATNARTNLGAAKSGANTDITALSGLTTALTVGQGGSGVGTLATNGVLIGQGASPLTTAVAGSTGLCLVSTAGAPSFQACPGSGGVTSLNGGNGVLSVSNASLVGSTITLNDATTSTKGISSFSSTNFTVTSGAVDTVQNITTAAAPTFGQLSLTSSQATNPMLLINNTNVAASGNLLDVQLNGTSKLSVAPTGNLSIVGTITAGTLNGQTISSSASFTGSVAIATTLQVNTITPSAALVVGASGQSFTLQGNTASKLTSTNGTTTTTVSFQNPTANVTYNFAATTAGTYSICTTAGNCVGGGGGVTTPGGTTNKLAKFSGSQSLADSIITDDGTTITVAGPLSVNTLTPSSALTVGATSQNLTLQGATVSLSATSGGITNSLTFATPTTSNKTITIPNASGTVVVSASGPLALDANGNLTCANCLTSGGSGGTSGVSSVNTATGALTIQGAGAGSVSLSGTTITINDASTALKGLASFNSTNFTVTSGAVNTIQGIATTSAPTFGGLSLTTALSVTNGGTGAITAGAARTNLGAATSGANSDITALSGLTTALSVVQGGTGATTLTANGILIGNGTGAITSLTGSNGQCLVVSSGAPTFATCPGGGGLTGSGTTGKISKFTSSGVLGDSIITDTGTAVTIAGNSNVTTGNQYQVNGTQISSANLSNDGNLAKLTAAQTFTGTTNAFRNSADSTGGFVIQNAAGRSLLNVDTTNSKFTFGNITSNSGQGIAGTIVLADGTNDNFGITLNSSTLTASHTVSLPNEDGIVCLRNSANCGFLTGAAANGSYVQLQGATPGSAQTGSFNITGTGIAATVLTSSLDAASATALSLGTTTASSVAIGKNGATTTVNGSLTSSQLLTASSGVTITGGSLTNNRASVYGMLALGDFAAGGSIGSAATTVDTSSAISIAQTTASQTLTIPNPTSTSTNHLLFFTNNGSASFTIAGNVLAAGGTLETVWNGTSWVPIGNTSGSTGVSVVGAIDSQTPSANGAVISSTNIYLQSASASNPGLVNTGTQTIAGSKTLNGNLSIIPTSGVAATIQGAAGQDIADFVNSAGTTIMVKIDQNGGISASGGAFTNSTNGSNSGLRITQTDLNTTSTAAIVNTLSLTINGTNNSNVGANINNALLFNNVTARTNNTFNGLYFGTSYDTILNYNGTSIISGLGKVQNAGFDSAINYSNIQILTTVTVTGSITVGSGGNAFTITPGTFEPILTGTARHSKLIVLPARYAGAVTDTASDTGGTVDCSVNNTGTLTNGYVATGRQNYYNWTVAGGSTQCEDVIVQIPVPSDWSAWNGAPTLYTYDSVGTDSTSVMVDVIDSTGTNDTNYSASAYNGVTSGTTFSANNLPALGGTYSTSGYLTMKIRLSGASSSNVRIGNISLNYFSKY